VCEIRANPGSGIPDPERRGSDPPEGRAATYSYIGTGGEGERTAIYLLEDLLFNIEFELGKLTFTATVQLPVGLFDSISIPPL
jgi:hypothetical protein